MSLTSSGPEPAQDGMPTTRGITWSAIISRWASESDESHPR